MIDKIYLFFIYSAKYRYFTILSSNLHTSNLFGNLKVYGILSPSSNKKDYSIIYACIHVYRYTQTYKKLYVCIYKCIRTYIHTYIHTSYTYIYTHIYIYIHIYIIYIYTNIHSFKCTSIFKYSYPKEAHKIKQLDGTYICYQLQFALLEKS